MKLYFDVNYKNDCENKINYELSTIAENTDVIFSYFTGIEKCFKTTNQDYSDVYLIKVGSDFKQLKLTTFMKEIGKSIYKVIL